MASIAEIDEHTDLLGALRGMDVEFDLNVELASYTYLRTGGVARLLIHPSSPEKLAAVVGLLHTANRRFMVIGSTSNLLFMDDREYTILVSTRRLTQMAYDSATGVITTECGAMMPDLSRLALYHGRTGFEGLEGIPGTIGGGLYMNAGAYGSELKDMLIGVEVIHQDGRIEAVSAEALGLRHRGSKMRNGEYPVIVARCTFRSEPGNVQRIFSKMEVYHAARHKYQDWMYPNLGSIFSGSPYRALSDRDLKFRIQSAIFYFFRYKFRIFHRESPINRKWLNDRVVSSFGFKYSLQPFSDKTLNCLVNRGQGTDEMIRFIRQMESLIDGKVPIENEIVEPF